MLTASVYMLALYPYLALYTDASEQEFGLLLLQYPGIGPTIEKRVSEHKDKLGICIRIS